MEVELSILNIDILLDALKYSLWTTELQQDQLHVILTLQIHSEDSQAKVPQCHQESFP